MNTKQSLIINSRCISPIAVIALILLFSGCLAPFDVAQEARTLEPRHVQLRSSLGSAEGLFGARYGIVNGWDAGIDYGINYFAPSITGMASFDTKVELFKKSFYTVSIGPGVGTGSHYLPGYVKAKENDSNLDKLPASFFQRSLDIYLPVYTTFYFKNSIIYGNVFGIYRLSDWEGNKVNGFYPGVSVGVIDILKNESLRFNTGISYIFYYVQDVPYPNNNPKKFLDGYANVVDYSGGLTWEFDPKQLHLFHHHKKNPPTDQ